MNVIKINAHEFLLLEKTLKFSILSLIHGLGVLHKLSY